VEENILLRWICSLHAPAGVRILDQDRSGRLPETPPRLACPGDRDNMRGNAHRAASGQTMASESSFDIVSKIDRSMDNAIGQTRRRSPPGST